ncbi:MAG TPA: hypothetical protein PLI66_05195, partial [Spirochaetales bacterium]|nr:hypothetical protein [Spirochaetales bacterium]
MSIKRRFDGTMIDVPAFSRMMLFVMPRKSDALVYFEHEVDVTETLEYVHEINRELTKRKSVLTLFELVMCAAVRTIVERPRLNRFVSDYRFYQRNRIEFSFVAKKELSDDGEEVTVKIPYSPFETLESLAVKTKRFIRRAVSDDGMTTEKIIEFVARLPNWMVRLIAGSVDFLEGDIHFRFHGTFPQQPPAEGVDGPDKATFDVYQRFLIPPAGRAVRLARRFFQADLEPRTQLARRLAGEGDR